jgi:hypothetical protein
VRVAALEKELQTGEMAMVYAEVATIINRIARGFIGRRRALHRKEYLTLQAKRRKAAIKCQSTIRMYLAKCRVKHIRDEIIRQLVMAMSATTIARWVRGHMARKMYRQLRFQHKALEIQRVFRGYLGRRAAKHERDRLEDMQKRNHAATKIQGTWRMKVRRL